MRDAYAEAEAASPLQTVRLLATSGPIESTPVDGNVLDFGTASSVHAPRLADALPPNSEPALHAGKREASAAMALPSEEPQPLASGEHLEPSEPVTEQEEDEALSAASGVITLCPVGDEPRLRAQLSKSRAQLHAAQLSMQRSAGELSTLRASLVQEGTARTQLQRQVEDCAAAGGEVISPHAIEAVRGALVQLAEGRIHELESALQKKDEQLIQLQGSTWGAWAQDQGINAELGRLQAELSQAHTLNKDLSSRLGGTEKTRGNENRAAEAARAQLSARLDTTTSELSTTSARAHNLAAELTDERSQTEVLRGNIEALRSTEGALREALADREAQLHVAGAQIETLEEEMVVLRRGSSAAQLSARYDEQIELLQRQSAAHSARDAEAVRVANAALAEAQQGAERMRSQLGQTDALKTQVEALGQEVRVAKAALAESQEHQAQLTVQLEAAKDQAVRSQQSPSKPIHASPLSDDSPEAAEPKEQLQTPPRALD
jgi:chromosome segregation ATPase